MNRIHASATLTFLAGILLSSLITLSAAQEKPTSLTDARAAIEANMSTAPGKAYDEQFGTELLQKHMGPLKQCKQSAGGDLTSFWMLFKLDKEGNVREMLLSPETKLGVCASESLGKDKFAATPPRAGYWVSVYLKLK
jgi:hypothetical protein